MERSRWRAAVGSGARSAAMQQREMMGVGRSGEMMPARSHMYAAEQTSTHTLWCHVGEILDFGGGWRRAEVLGPPKGPGGAPGCVNLRAAGALGATTDAGRHGALSAVRGVGRQVSTRGHHEERRPARVGLCPLCRRAQAVDAGVTAHAHDVGALDEAVEAEVLRKVRGEPWREEAGRGAHLWCGRGASFLGVRL